MPLGTRISLVSRRFRRWLVLDSSRWRPWPHSRGPAGTSPGSATAQPSSVISKTSGHSVKHMPWPAQRSSSTVTFIGALDDIELEVQLGQPAQDVSRDVLVVAIARRAVMLFADADVGGAVEQPLEPDPGLGTRQRSAGAAVDAAAEGQVLAGVLAVGVERVRILEAARIAVGRTVDHHQRAAGADRFLADGGRHPRQPEVTLDRTLDAQALLDEVAAAGCGLRAACAGCRAGPPSPSARY